MPQARLTVDSFDAGAFLDNANNFPPEELAKFAGLRIAWSLDGTRILASGHDDAEIDRKLRQSGLDPSQVVRDFVPPNGIALL